MRATCYISLQPVDSHVAHMSSRGRQNHGVKKMFQLFETWFCVSQQRKLPGV